LRKKECILVSAERFIVRTWSSEHFVHPV